MARAVALVPQSELAAEGFRVRQVVAMGRAPHQDGWMRRRTPTWRPSTRRSSGAILRAVADRPVETLSGGEQRRVAIARALAQKAKVLALDEPSAFLDVEHRLELYDLLAEVAQRDRVACVVAMHDLDAAARVATQVLLLRGGRMVASGPPGEVMTPALLGETFDVQLDAVVHEPSGARVFVALRRAAALRARRPERLADEAFELGVLGDAGAHRGDLARRATRPRAWAGCRRRTCAWSGRRDRARWGR